MRCSIIFFVIFPCLINGLIRQITIKIPVLCGKQRITGLINLTDRSGFNLDSWELTYADENLIHRQNFYSTSTDLANIIFDTPCGVFVKKDQVKLCENKNRYKNETFLGLFDAS